MATDVSLPLLFHSAAARNPYRMAMTHIILGRTDELFTQFANSLDGMKDVVSPE